MEAWLTSKRKEQRIPAIVRALVAVTPDSLKPASLATPTSSCAVDVSRHSAARMKGSNLKMSFEPAHHNSLVLSIAPGQLYTMIKTAAAVIQCTTTSFTRLEKIAFNTRWLKV